MVDEYHRGSAEEDSAWREILEYFSNATQIGMTATPKETRYVSNIDYFGDPVLRTIAPSPRCPLGWVRCLADEISIKITDGEHVTPQRSSTGHFLLSARNVKDTGIDLRVVDYVPKDEFERIRRRCDPNKGDILISCSGSVGRIALVDKDKEYVMVRSVALLKPFQSLLSSEYLVYLFRSPFVQDQILENKELQRNQICSLVASKKSNC